MTGASPEEIRRGEPGRGPGVGGWHGTAKRQKGRAGTSVGAVGTGVTGQIQLSDTCGYGLFNAQICLQC